MCVCVGVCVCVSVRVWLFFQGLGARGVELLGILGSRVFRDLAFRV